ncbi:MAG TPA: hypothetical protein VEL80_01390 [Burkholderiales bacterium]|nr:hypothetical protein [Burkholderiales bacterium]HYT15034.1 hypothetical protein [Burkholderiales bacterium]
MKYARSVVKAVVGVPNAPRKAAMVTVVSAIAAIGTALGVQIEPKELLRPVLASAGFFEISAAHQDTEALIKRIQDIDQAKPDHALITQLRVLSKESRMPFEGREREIHLRLSHRVAVAGDVGVVCRGSELRDTSLQYEFGRGGLVNLRLEDDDTCNQAHPDEVQLSPEIWHKLDLRAAASDAKLTMNVLLHPLVERPADTGSPPAVRNATEAHRVAALPN